jgi:hypothetical protein
VSRLDIKSSSSRFWSRCDNTYHSGRRVYFECNCVSLSHRPSRCGFSAIAAAALIVSVPFPHFAWAARPSTIDLEFGWAKLHALQLRNFCRQLLACAALASTPVYPLVGSKPTEFLSVLPQLPKRAFPVVANMSMPSLMVIFEAMRSPTRLVMENALVIADGATPDCRQC